MKPSCYILPISWIVMLALILTLAICRPCRAQEITEGVNKGLTVQEVIHDRIAGMEKLVKDAQDKTMAVQSRYDDQTSKLKLAVDYGNSEHTGRVEAEKERDSLIWIFSLTGAIAAIGFALPLLKSIGMPWVIVADIGVFLAAFATCYTVGRTALHFLAQFTPHLPI